MAGNTVGRREFMTTLGRVGAGGCVCGAALAAESALAAETPERQETPQQAQQTRPGEQSQERAAKRMEFVDVWVPRFFEVLDSELDERARRRIMVANGKACYSDYRPDSPTRAEPATLDSIAAWVADRGPDTGYSMEGDAVILEYVSSAETEEAAPEGVCLCPTAEAQRPGSISPSFCWCSVGYVKEMHDRFFGRPVDVELVHSVLTGQPRCRFRITLL